MVFAVTFKVFSTISGRRFICDLEYAHERGYIDKVPHFNSLYNYLEPASMTPILTDLITRSSLPLKVAEQDFAIDSSDFRRPSSSNGSIKNTGSSNKNMTG